MGLENHSQAIVLGDLNFRIDAYTREEVIERIKSNNLGEILDQDDLIKAFDRFKTQTSTGSDKFTDLLFTNF
jgi:hypothetical protein